MKRFPLLSYATGVCMPSIQIAKAKGKELSQPSLPTSRGSQPLPPAYRGSQTSPLSSRGSQPLPPAYRGSQTSPLASRGSQPLGCGFCCGNLVVFLFSTLCFYPYFIPFYLPAWLQTRSSYPHYPLESSSLYQ